jgi:hypothetical protein
MGFDLFLLLVKSRRKEKETIVLPLESGLSFGDPAFSQDHALLTREDRVHDELPFLEGYRLPFGIDRDHAS